MTSLPVFMVLISVILAACSGFSVGGRTTGLQRTNFRSVIAMEYIPTGLTKAQWDEIKKKEADELKKKSLGALGTTKFKSRSFEAWQKAGGKHLFPVDPKTTPYEERPYMQRKDGDWEGNDLKKRGLTGVGQAAASNRNNFDDLYEGLKKEGKLDSVSIFGGAKLPWTNSDAAKISSQVRPNEVAVSAKKLSPEEMERLKRNLVKPIVSKKADTAPAEAAPAKKKGLFGLF